GGCVSVLTQRAAVAKAFLFFRKQGSRYAQGLHFLFQARKFQLLLPQYFIHIFHICTRWDSVMPDVRNVSRAKRLVKNNMPVCHPLRTCPYMQGLMSAGM